MNNDTRRRAFIQAIGAGAAALAAGAAPADAVAGPVAAQAASPRSMGARFRDLLRSAEPVQCIAAFDPPSARLVELAGYPAIFVGGSDTALVQGLPDVGLTSMTEMIASAAAIIEQTGIPVLADADHGGGAPVAVYRTMAAFARAGAGAVMFEDRIRTERIGQRADVVSPAEMVGRIRAAVDASSEPVVVARCDALAAGRPMSEAIDRGAAYAEAGAELLFFAGLRFEDMPKVTAAVQRPLMAQMSADTMLARARESRVTIAVYTSLLQDIALGAVHRALTELKTTGTMIETAKLSLPRDVQNQLTRTREITERAAKYQGR